VKAGDIKVDDEIAISRYAPSERCSVIQTAEHSARLLSSYARNYRRPAYRSVAAAGGIRSGVRKQISVCHPVPDLIELSAEFGRLIGLFLAEGNVDGGKVVWSFAETERDTLVAETFSLIQELFGIETSVSRPRPGSMKVSLHSTPFAQVFESLCGNGSGNKRLHPDLAMGPDEFREAMLRGWLAGDGYDRDARGNVLQGVTVSKQLALDMFSIASSLGMAPTIRYGEPKPSHGVKTRQPRYDVYVLKEDRGGSWQSRHTETHTWRKVRAVEKVSYVGPVYNFSVTGDE
jgi:intein/homing endonuclease